MKAEIHGLKIMPQPLTIEEYDELLTRYSAGEITWPEFRQRLIDAGNYHEIVIELGRRYPPPPKNLTLTHDEQDDLLRLYAVGYIGYRTLREFDEFEHYGDVIEGLGRLGLGIPITPIDEGPNVESRLRAIAIVRKL